MGSSGVRRGQRAQGFRGAPNVTVLLLLARPIPAPGRATRRPSRTDRLTVSAISVG
jgi:hypothetical protein